jgi:hypothetical protein
MGKRAFVLACLAMLTACGSGPSPDPVPATITETFQGTLVTPGGFQSRVVGPAGAGQWTAELTWTDASGAVALEVFNPDGTFVGRGERPTATAPSRTFSWSGSAGASFRVDTYLQLTVNETYTLRVTRPGP